MQRRRLGRRWFLFPKGRGSQTEEEEEEEGGDFWGKLVELIQTAFREGDMAEEDT